jgi:GntR family transcriptional regulator
MLQKTEPDAPAYRRIQYALQKRIEAGELQPGDAVPSERELARSHEVSLMTARHALAELEREGLVDRRRGAGTFVALPKIHFNRLASFTEQMASRGLPARSRILCADIVEGEQEAAARLALPAHSRLVKIERLRQSGEQPFALESCYLPADDFAGLLSLPLERRSLFATLEREYGIDLQYADEEVDATPASARTAELLGIHGGSPVLRIRQALFSTAGKATLYVIGFYRSDRHTLLIRRFRR